MISTSLFETFYLILRADNRLYLFWLFLII